MVSCPVRERIERLTLLYLSRPGLVVTGAIALTLLALLPLRSLRIDSDQLSLLPAHSVHVKAAREVERIMGGTGFLLVTLKISKADQADLLLRDALHTRFMAGDEQQAAMMFEEVRLQDAESRKDRLSNGILLRQAADELAAELQKVKHIQYVEHTMPVDFFAERRLLFLPVADLTRAVERLRQAVRAWREEQDPLRLDILGERKHLPEIPLDLLEKEQAGGRQLRERYLISADEKLALIRMKPAFSLNDTKTAKEVRDRVIQVIADSGISKRGIAVGLTGSYMQFIENYEAVRQSLASVMIYSFAGIALVLYFFIRPRRLIPLLLLPLGLSVLWTFALTALVIGRLNLITSMFGGILAGLGIDFGIHFLYRFQELQARNPARDQVVAQMAATIADTLPAALLSAGTTALAFASLMLSDFNGFREFGLISSYGLLITALSMFLLTPVLLLLTLQIRPSFLDRTVRTQRSLFFRAVDTGIVAPRALLLIFVLSVPLLAYFAGKVGWERDSRNMVKNDIPSKLLYEEVGFRFGAAGEPFAMVSHTLEEAGELYSELFPLSAKRKEYIAQVLSVYTLAPPVEQQRANINLLRNFLNELDGLTPDMLPAKYRKLFYEASRAAKLEPYGPEDLPAQILRSLRGKDGSWLTLIYPDVSKILYTEDMQTIHRLVGTVEYGPPGNRKVVHTAGTTILVAELMTMVQAQSAQIILLSLLLVICALYVAYRRSGAVILAAFPLLAGLLLCAAFAGFFSVHISYFNVSVIPIIIGYGIDSGVFLYQRFGEGESVQHTMRHTGLAVVASSLTTLAGWGSLALAGHPGLAGMGYLACLGIGSVLFAAIFLTPALYLLSSNGRARANGRIKH
ncbi:MAG: MMPL family transporter [Spirochaetales bacterium]|nr:MMPL family transporter [Spirochaetales bacterium]